MSVPAAAVAVLVSLAILTSCGGDADVPGTAPQAGTITVYAAASLTDAMSDLAAAFEAAAPGATVDVNFGPSSGLREQILAGAPADVYASANQSNMDQLVAAGAAVDPVVFTRNSLEIVVPAGNPGGVTSLADFADPARFIGLCAEEVPCGAFGREVLAKAGVEPSLDTNAPDVRALLTQVASGDLDAGIVYRTDVMAAGHDVEGIEIPADADVVADYPIARLAASGAPELADAFVTFVRSDQGQAILASFGFGAP